MLRGEEAEGEAQEEEGGVLSWGKLMAFLGIAEVPYWVPCPPLSPAGDTRCFDITDGSLSWLELGGDGVTSWYSGKLHK